MNTCHDIIFIILLFYLHTFSLQESQEDGICHATTFAAISFYVLFYFYFVLYWHCCKNKLSIYLECNMNVDYLGMSIATLKCLAFQTYMTLYV